MPLQQWLAKVILNGALSRYTLRLRLPDLDDAPDPTEGAAVAYVTGARGDQHPLPRPADRQRPAPPGS